MGKKDAENGERTSRIAQCLLKKGLMVDYAPGPRGKMIRAVVNIQTKKSTVEALVKQIEEIGSRL